MQWKVDQRRERESRGEGSIYSLLQPFERPDVSELINRRIDVLCAVKINQKEKQKLRWCQGEVVHVYENKKQPWVRVLWDATPDIKGWEQ